VTVRVEVDMRLCCGAGQCAWFAPEVFDQSESDGTVTVLRPEPPSELHAGVRQAERWCPTGAIALLAGGGPGPAAPGMESSAELGNRDR
jgi:ferredoxin